MRRDMVVNRERKRFAVVVALLMLGLLAGCVEEPEEVQDMEPALRGVFTLSNEVGENEVIFFERADDGTLTEAGRFPTGGTGTGKSIIGSQHPLEVTKDNRFLLAVSPGSDELTAFAVTDDGLERTDVVDSGGKKPVSVTALEGGLVYVLNLNGGKGGLAGFTLSDDGDLTPIPESERQLSNDPNALPPQVEFSPNGNVLVVTERFAGETRAVEGEELAGQGRIVTYTIDPDGLLSEPMIHPPAGRTPFGMMFTDEGVLIVSEAFEKNPGNPIPKEGKASSFRVSESGALEVISRSVPALGTATCWVQISEDGRFAWMTNTGSATITTYGIGTDGTLERLHLTPAGKMPIGMAASTDGNFLYALDAKTGSIIAFEVDESDGNLTQFQKVDFSPDSAFGMMALTSP